MVNEKNNYKKPKSEERYCSNVNVHANVVVGVSAPREGDVTARMEVDDPALREIEVTAQVDFTAQDDVTAQVEVTTQVDVVQAHVDAEAQVRCSCKS